MTPLQYEDEVEIAIALFDLSQIIRNLQELLTVKVGTQNWASITEIIMELKRLNHQIRNKYCGTHE